MIESSSEISRETCRMQIVDGESSTKQSGTLRKEGSRPGDACCHRQRERKRNTRFIGGSGRQESEPS